MFIYISREESRKNVMMGGQIIQSMENSAYIFVVPENELMSGQKAFKKGEERSNKVWYNYCNKPGHTRETYWKLHGKLVNRKK